MSSLIRDKDIIFQNTLLKTFIHPYNFKPHCSCKLAFRKKKGIFVVEKAFLTWWIKNLISLSLSPQIKLTSILSWSAYKTSRGHSLTTLTKFLSILILSNHLFKGCIKNLKTEVHSFDGNLIFHTHLGYIVNLDNPQNSGVYPCTPTIQCYLAPL